MDNPKFEKSPTTLLSKSFLSIVHSVQEAVVSEEIMHNLDTCEVTVVGDELDGEHEGLEVDMSQLQQHSLEMSSSNLGLVITGTDTELFELAPSGAIYIIIALQKILLYMRSKFFEICLILRPQM